MSVHQREQETTFIEREDSLQMLISAVEAASAGQGQVVILSGEAGIGKTSLLRELTQRLPTAPVLWGGCEALHTPRPLGPLQDMAPAISQPVADLLQGTATQERIFPTLLHELQKRRRPRTLVFEDVHWADNATLDLIKYLGRRISLLPAVLVLSLRSDEVSAEHPLLQVLGDLPAMHTTRISLEPLSEEGVAALASTSGASGAELHRITGGNPFFVTELLADQDGNDGNLPASIRDAVWARLARFGDDERKLLDVMSIVPGGIEPELARSLLGDMADAAIDACAARNVVWRDGLGHWKFRHELARKAALERLPLSAQTTLHAEVEEAMSHLGSPLSRRVHHAAGAGNAARVLELAPRAATEASQLGAHMEAATHLSTALQYVTEAPDELSAQLHEDWAYEAGLALKIDETIIEARQKAVALWQSLGRPEKVSHNLRWLSRLHWYRGEAQIAADYVDQAIAVLDGMSAVPELAMAYSMRSQMHMLHDRTDEAISWGLRAIALAEELEEVETRVHALNNVGSALLLSGRNGGRKYMEESLTLALQHGFHEQAARAYTNFAEYAVLFKDFALAERVLSEGIAFDTKHDLDSWTHYLVGRQAQLRMDQGRFHDAETIARGVLSLDRLTLIMRLPALTVLAKVRTCLGGTDGPELLQQALKDALATGEPQYITPVRFGLIEAAWLSGDTETCHAELNAVAAMRLEGFDPWELGELALWWQRAGMKKPFPVSVDKIAPPFAAELNGNAEEAADLWTRLGLPYHAALALMSDKTKVAEATRELEALDAAPAAALARKRASAQGIEIARRKVRRGPYGAARKHPLGLTARELEVLELLAEGMSNQDIAKKIVRSPRTVEHHVSAVLGKFNAGSRMEVILRLRSEPWLLQGETPTSEVEK